MNLANIHAVRKSFLTLRSHCNSAVDQARYGVAFKGLFVKCYKKRGDL